MINLAVFFGGRTAEHDVSIITALQCMAAELKLAPVYLPTQRTRI